MLLGIVAGFFLVSCALGFGLGWYVRGAYPARRYVADDRVEPPHPWPRPPGRRGTYADHTCADCAARDVCRDRTNATVLTCSHWRGQ